MNAKPPRIEVFAPAKINLGLAVTGRRTDGYHELDTIFAALDVGDSLVLERSDSAEIELEVLGANLPKQENLVYRAAEAFLQQAKITAGLRIRLEKRLPLAAGLGGGSSDAAATLRGLAQIFPVDVDLHRLALRLGADVPFFLQRGARQARGIGEVFEAITLPDLHVVLANPGVGISAKEAYLGLKGRFGPALDVSSIVEALKQHQNPPYRNDLELAVLEAYPVVAEVKAALSEAGLHGVLMSGSGSSCFGLAQNAGQAARAAQQIAQRQPHWWVVSTRTLC